METFIRLKNTNSFCVIKLNDNSEKSEEKDKQVTQTSIKLTFLSLTSIDEEIEKLLMNIKDCISGINEWEDGLSNNTIKKLAKDFELPNFGQRDYSLAQHFADSSILETLITIKSVGGLLRSDVVNKLNIENPNEILTKLQKLKLIRSEYIILCKKTSEYVNKAPNKESIEAVAKHGIRCSRCNRLLTEENLEEYLTTTEEANQMIDGSHWMTVNLVKALFDLDVPKGSVLVNVHEGYEEIDALVGLGKSLLLFELKDSQFSIGHAYAFQSRLSLYGADIGIIWATDGVAPEVIEHFNRLELDAKIHYIESVDSLVPSLSKILDELRWEIAENELKPLLRQGSIVINVPQGIIQFLKKNIRSWRQDYKDEVAVTQEEHLD